ncbi:HK97 gp10 family phage protein [Alcaligenes endophyticus]|uniref:HK97 gp10 family phage protein n=1 Tax=Alcaligenes endophyticus TaxID=1929088 RepID=A0ABT8EKB9_9BURK|nr:HK97 gp10 family phage protein [Alcaligenes endophyticus]MCX5592027.1 HK97 gp10 family phage protein [Alcaligenes endophyticus]MDN4121717.1 HK97 gp10 family phage protein [Alcaligenes endophyticus]
MAKTGLSVDFKQALKALDSLAEASKSHLSRSMAVATGKVLRDEAKVRAPVFDGSTALAGGANAIKPPRPGALREAIYLAFSDNRSSPSDGRFVYSVSWNSSTAPHGHLLEFGHWRYNEIHPGGFPTKKPLDSPQWVAAIPFLRPAHDAAVDRAMRAGLERGKERATELLADPSLLEGFGA